MLHLWPGLLRVCILNLNAFSCKLALFLALLLFENVLHWSLSFVLWYLIFFNPRNRQIGVAVFMIAKIIAFCDVLLAVPCAIHCRYMCFIFSFLALYMWLQCYLIFCIAFAHCLPVFLGPIPHFCMFWCVHVCFGTTDSFFCNFPHHMLLLLALRTFYMHCFGKSNSFCGVRGFFLMISLLGLVLNFFAVNSAYYINLRLLVLGGFVFFECCVTIYFGYNNIEALCNP